MTEKEFFTDKLLVRIYLVIEMISSTGLAPWEFEIPFSVSRASTFLGVVTLHTLHTWCVQL